MHFLLACALAGANTATIATSQQVHEVAGIVATTVADVPETFIASSVSAPPTTEAIRDSLVQLAQFQRFSNKYALSLTTLDALGAIEPNHPRSHFMKAAVLLAETFDSGSVENHDRFLAEIDAALVLTDQLEASGEDQAAEAIFLRGAAIGYRGAYAVITNAWWDAFNDGRKGLSMLKKSVELDPDNYDAYLGLGMFTYWRSKLTSRVSWLPFIGDEREKGIKMIRLAAEHGEWGREEALGNLIIVMSMEGQGDEILEVALPQLERYPSSRFLLRAAAVGSHFSGHYTEANQYYQRLREEIPAEGFEVYPNLLHYDLAQAQIAIAQEHDAAAARLCRRLLSYPAADLARFDTAREKARKMLVDINRRYSEQIAASANSR